jgi:hypothetical protein
VEELPKERQNTEIQNKTVSYWLREAKHYLSNSIINVNHAFCCVLLARMYASINFKFSSRFWEVPC